MVFPWKVFLTRLFCQLLSIARPEVFHHYQKNLKATILGFTRVASNGDVNASRRGQKYNDLIGPGGFCDITDSAQVIIFLGSICSGGDIRLEKGRVKIYRYGNPKLLPIVDEVTFCALEMLVKIKIFMYVN